MRAPLTERQAVHIAATIFGKAGVAGELPSYEDRNFHLKGDGSESYVLKIVDVKGPTPLALSVAALAHLARVAPALNTPRPIAAADGRFVVQKAIDGHLFDIALLTFVRGTLLADARPLSRPLLTAIGRYLGRLDWALSGFDHPAAHRAYRWAMLDAGWVGEGLSLITDEADRELVAFFDARFETQALPVLSRLPRAVIHNDANDYNILVAPAESGEFEVRALLDFGDILSSPQIAEPAVAAAYAILGQDEPVQRAAALVAGYHQERPLTIEEVRLLYDLIARRLCVSVTSAAEAQAADPDNEYISVSAVDAWPLLRQWQALGEKAVTEHFLAACGLTRSTTAAVPSLLNHLLPATRESTVDTLLNARRSLLAPSLSLAYEQPLHIVRGEGPYLYDVDGQPYLDLVNNVAHVGHCHPKVVAAGQRQMELLNTNTRYLHGNLVEYADRLTALLPDPLSVCFFVCSGSEANDLALRLARTHTGRQDVIVLEGAYHGNLTSLVAISPYKFDGPGGAGVGPDVHVAPMPDGYNGRYRGADSGPRYAETVADIVKELVAAGRPPAAFIAEALLGCGGQIEPPPGFLAPAFAAVRAAGGVCIADEVQIGFGRVGSHFWGFETQGVVPDIVTLGKPIGNGHPLAAVITTPAIAASFANGMEYFNTFGGNPVSCAIGLAVLDVIAEEKLQQRALTMGHHFRQHLRALQEKHPLIGDVRGRGLFLGVELVANRATRIPAPQVARYVIERLKAHGILLSVDGPRHNVLKIKPPLVISRDDIDWVVTMLDDVLAEDIPSER